MLQEDPNQIWLFDPDNKTLFDKPVYTTPDSERLTLYVNINTKIIAFEINKEFLGNKETLYPQYVA